MPPLPSAGAGILGGGGGRASDESLVASMAARLAQVEQANRRLTEKAAEQAQELETLRAQLGMAQQPDPDASEGAAHPPTEVRVLRAERDRLRKQVDGMTKFLAEYGLTWTAQTADAYAGDSASPRRKGQSDTPGPSPSEGGELSVNITVLKERVQALNDELEEARSGGVVKHGKGANAAQLVAGAAEPVPVTFFGDGVKVGDRAFLAYETRPAQGLIKDILDGSFPHMMREEFPSGTPLCVMDRTRHASYRIWARDLAVYDPELAEGGERLRPAVGSAVRNPRDAMSNAERLVDKLPERVLRGGKVCEVKGPLAERLGVDLQKGVGSAAAAAAGSIAAGGGGRRASLIDELSLVGPGCDAEAPVVRLQVKLDGGQKLVIRAENHTTVGVVWDAVAKWGKEHGMLLVDGKGMPRALRTAFPPRTYTDKAETLQAAGLVPSATLFVAAAGGVDD